MPYNKKIDPKALIRSALEQEKAYERKPQTEQDERIARLQEISGGLYGSDKEQSAKMVEEANEAMKKRREAKKGSKKSWFENLRKQLSSKE